MFADTLNALYSSLKIYFYMQVYSRFEKREATLTTVESYSIECINALGNPTVSEFAAMMKISSPNAAAKINSLINKGYCEKIQSEEDRREYHLRPTGKYREYAKISSAYMEVLAERCEKRFTPEEMKNLEDMLRIIHDELMPEIDLQKYMKDNEN